MNAEFLKELTDAFGQMKFKHKFTKRGHCFYKRGYWVRSLGDSYNISFYAYSYYTYVTFASCRSRNKYQGRCCTSDLCKILKDDDWFDRIIFEIGKEHEINKSFKKYDKYTPEATSNNDMVSLWFSGNLLK